MLVFGLQTIKLIICQILNEKIYIFSFEAHIIFDPPANVTDKIVVYMEFNQANIKPPKKPEQKVGNQKN